MSHGTTTSTVTTAGHNTRPITPCDNCGTALQGGYCHHCGQSAHNPIHHFGHAVEEVFESFWHLDGRIFRTLRNLMRPGRVARAYLDGHRVRYIPPLRLFVVLSLLTFFVGRMVLHLDTDTLVDRSPSAFARDTTVAAVQQRQDTLLAELRAAEAEVGDAPGARSGLIVARNAVRKDASERIAQLRGPSTRAAVTAPTAPADTSDSSPPAATSDHAEASIDCRSVGSGSPLVTSLPEFARHWLRQRLTKACNNVRHFDTESGRLTESIMAAIPGALFVLMPVFALLLKLMYLGSGRSYLEHLVVALYSHAFLLLMLLAAFLLAAASSVGVSSWINQLGEMALWIWTPLYLLLMQKHVYAGRLRGVIPRYLAIGLVYFVMVLMVTLYAVFIGLSS